MESRIQAVRKDLVRNYSLGFLFMAAWLELIKRVDLWTAFFAHLLKLSLSSMCVDTLVVDCIEPHLVWANRVANTRELLYFKKNCSRFWTAEIIHFITLYVWLWIFFPWIPLDRDIWFCILVQHFLLGLLPLPKFFNNSLTWDCNSKTRI